MFNSSGTLARNVFRHSGHLRTVASRTFAGALLLLCGLQARATTIEYKNFNDLVKESDAVVSGRVASIESKYSKDKEDIYTFVTLDRLDTLSGSYSAPTVTLRFLGGEVGNDVLNVAGSPNFKPNENVIVFVHGNGRNMVPVVGWTQGVFRIANDALTGQQVIRDHDGNRVFGLQNGALLKEQTFQPEAQIVGPQGVQLGATKDMEVNAGSNDYAAPVLRGTAPSGIEQQRPIGSLPPMTVAAFERAIRSAPVSKATNGVLRSIGPNDADVPADHNDASAGPTLAPVTPSQPQAPALPKPAKPQVPAVEQQ